MGFQFYFSGDSKGKKIHDLFSFSDFTFLYFENGMGMRPLKVDGQFKMEEIEWMHVDSASLCYLLVRIMTDPPTECLVFSRNTCSNNVFCNAASTTK